MREIIKVKGIIEIQKFERGKLIEEYYFENLLTDSGFDYLTKLIGNTNAGGINKLNLGSSNVAASTSDTALKNKLVSIDVRADYTIPKTIKFMGIVPEGTVSSTVSYLEAGLVRKDAITETLITRSVFNSAVFQKPETSLSMIYSLIFQ